MNDRETIKENNHFDTIIAGGGIAGLVTALELLKKDQKVCLIDRDKPENLGGLARLAFGGMALCGTPQQRKMKVPDSPSLLLKDWLNFAEFSQDEDTSDIWPTLWAKEYAQHNHQKVYQWLIALGLKFLPAVNWVERGLFVPGNSVPRYHILWGTGSGLIEKIIDHITPYINNKQLTLYHQHKVIRPCIEKDKAIGVEVINETLGQEKDKTFTLSAKNIVIACGGINGSTERVKQNWYKPWGAPPEVILNGANPISDGTLHDAVNASGGQLTRLDNMWNYAAGIKHPQAEYEGHGLSLIPSKSALWLDHLGKRIGPLPLVTGFDTNYLCEQVAKQEKPWTWQLLNWRIAVKELAVSGSAHNPSIRDGKLFSLFKEILFGNQRLIKQLEAECEDFICADSIEELVNKMNNHTDKAYIDKAELLNQVQEYDQRIINSTALQNDDQVRRIHHARQWKTDRLRTCKPAPILDKNSGKLIAIKVQLISRKSLGGVQTNLSSQVLNTQGKPIIGLYCVGEAAGFGGGGANGKRSLEGTFLSGCILTARNAADAIINTQ